MNAWPDELRVGSWSQSHAETVARWRYPGPWAVYDCPATGEGYRAVESVVDGSLVGYYCVGADAQVRGLRADDAVTDLGLGMAPEFVGERHGSVLMRAVLADVDATLAPKPLRAVIQSWNVRSLALAARFGFARIADHRCVAHGRSVDYTIVLRPGRADSQQSVAL